MSNAQKVSRLVSAQQEELACLLDSWASRLEQAEVQASSTPRQTTNERAAVGQPLPVRKRQGVTSKGSNHEMGGITCG